MEAQLTFDAADRLVDLVEERRGPVAADEAARALFALASAPTVLAHSLLDEVVSGDARLAWRGAAVALANDPTEQLPLEAASYVVVDLETTGLRPRRDLRDRRRPARRPDARRNLPDARRPGRPASSGRHLAHGHRGARPRRR